MEHVQNQQLKQQNDVIVLCSKLTIKTSARYQCHHSGIFIVNFEHFSYLVLVFFDDFEQMDVYRAVPKRIETKGSVAEAATGSVF